MRPSMCLSDDIPSLNYQTILSLYIGMQVLSFFDWHQKCYIAKLYTRLLFLLVMWFLGGYAWNTIACSLLIWKQGMMATIVQTYIFILDWSPQYIKHDNSANGARHRSHQTASPSSYDIHHRISEATLRRRPTLQQRSSILLTTDTLWVNTKWTSRNGGGQKLHQTQNSCVSHVTSVLFCAIMVQQ